jgi:hypothetical protein
MKEEHKNWIDNANYYQLLKRWRFSNMDNIFIGSTGQYYYKIMNQKCNALENKERVRISKLIGWG